MKFETESIEREYCAWETVVVESQDPAARLSLRGDLQGDLAYHAEKGFFFGFFELPARGEEKGYYEIVRRKNNREIIFKRLEIHYSFDDRYFSPRWENVDEVNRFIAEHYSHQARLEILYRYEQFGRSMQALCLTSSSAPDHSKQVILITGRVHNPESGMTSVCYRFIKWLLAGEGSSCLEHYIFLIVPMTIPLTFDEDERGHNVNRLWQPEITSPDLAAFRDRILDRHMPEIWIDCHSFNDDLPLHDPAQERMVCGDYVVAHPVGEKNFDHSYSTQIALQMIEAAEKAGHKHRNEEFFKSWAEQSATKLPTRPGETFETGHHPAGIFSGIDYARYADRGKFGIEGRDWPAMAGDYGYYHCHAVNLCLECKPLHVRHDGRVIHYSSVFPDSNVVKLKEVCRIGQQDFSGQPFPGFPCNTIAEYDCDGFCSVRLCAWGENRQEIRRSRYALWRSRFSILVSAAEETGKTTLTLECFAGIECRAALQLRCEDSRTCRIDGRISEPVTRKPFLYVPCNLRPGRTVFVFS